ncbi:hypothetical protein HRI_002802000 [Hibiscus trionum]|uniref:DUF4283 domain-containing protein n=1 Tax=Hibiscus trionum TaxID=183268 RepID=A0A9W7I9P3_HIBTR|nr:hypothetical protein HRI_002802000 [Hibiscus trionum]
MEGLAIEEDEDTGIQIEQNLLEQGISIDNCFVGQFLTSAVIHFQSMKTTLSNVWRPLGGVSISDIGENRYLFRFYHKIDVDRVEENGPWNFNSHLLILYRLKEGDVPLSVPLNLVPFWVLVNDVPPGCMSKGVARQLENFVGQFLIYDSEKVTLGYKGIMRIRIAVDVRRPLKL